MYAYMLALTGALAFAQTKMPPPVNHKVNFEKEVQPVLAQKCFACHGAEAQQAGLRLDRRQQAMRGGDYGPVIIAGRSAESKLIKRLVNGDGGLQMPPTGPLSDDEIGLLRAWIDQGADYRISVSEEMPARPVDPKLAALIEAVRGADTGAVRKLLTATPALVNAADAKGSTPLHHAAGFGTLATIKLLLDKGANVNAKNQRKSTPALWAVHDETKLRLLIEKGADVNARTNDGRTLLYQAASMGDGLSVMRLLLDKGAKVDAPTINGMTPLMAAAGRARLDAMRLLIERGADANLKNAAGATALMDAAATGSPRAVGILLEKGADAKARTKKNETALGDAATSGNIDVVRMLLDRGAEVNVQDIRGYSPLLYAAGSDTIPTEVVKLLLAKGADVNAKGDGETAVMLASKRGDTPVARLLGAPAKSASATNLMKAAATGGPERTIAQAVKPALELLEKQSHNFIRIGGCNSCHGQDLPSGAAALARDRGLPAPKSIPQLPQHMIANTTERLMDLNAIGPVSVAWELFDFGMNRVPRDHYTDAVVRYIKATQSADGSWSTNESHRPPMSTGAYQTAALCIYSIRHYGRTEDQEENAKAIARAAAWLEASSPRLAQDHAFRVMGLAWAKAKPASITAATRELAALQRADGGWGQMATMPADAYATGEALYALNAAAGNTDAFRKGIKYLLRTQAPDGSWHVASRSIWLQPYFESGFPYGTDQWISVAGTSWAVMALSVSVETPKIAGRR